MSTFNDNFNEAGASAVVITSHTPDTGTGWVEAENTSLQQLDVQPLSAGVCQPSGNEGNDRFLYSTNPEPSTADLDVQFTVDGVGANANSDTYGIYARFQDVNNYYALLKRRNASTVDTQFWKLVGGTATLIEETNSGTVTGDIYMLELRGSTIRVLRDTGSGFTELMSNVDTDISAAGAAGIFYGNAFVSTDDIDTAFSISNFQWAEVGAPAGTILPQMMQHYHGS